MSPEPVIFERLFDLLFDAPKLDAALLFGDLDREGTEFADGFIRRFIAANDLSRLARSISISQGFRRPATHGYLPAQCIAPRKQNFDAPKMQAFDEQLRGADYDVQKGDLYVFENKGSGRRLQVFATTALVVAVNNPEDLFLITLTID